MVIFSTLLAILDGFPRITASFWLALRSADGRVNIPLDGSRELLVSMVMMGLGAMALLLWLMASFTQFIDLTAIATFLLAPFLALLNHRAVFGRRCRSTNSRHRICASGAGSASSSCLPLRLSISGCDSCASVPVLK
jgi:hypothetical protein